MIGVTKKGKIKKPVLTWLESHKDVILKWISEDNIAPLVEGNLPEAYVIDDKAVSRQAVFHRVFLGKRKLAIGYQLKADDPFTVMEIRIHWGTLRHTFNDIVGGIPVPVGGTLDFNWNIEGKELIGFLIMCGFVRRS
jgi:hypothetical protein